MDRAALLLKMQQDWDARARDNARYYGATGNKNWSEDEFYESGQRSVARSILTDMENICQGKDPKQMRVLEISRRRSERYVRISSLVES